MILKIILVYLLFLSNYYVADSTLELVHVFFRHGSRAPTEFESYPNNPHLDYWRKVGFGKLTDVGKRQSFQLGKILGKRYQGFLSSYYKPEEVLTKSTDYNRTLQTALLVLDGIFSSKNTTSPYLIYYQEDSKDYELRGVHNFCYAYEKEVNRLKSTQAFLTHEIKYKNLYRIASQETGKTYESTLDIFFLFQNLYSEMYVNLTLPKWAQGFYETMHEIADLEMFVQNFGNKLMRLSGGTSLKQIFQNMKGKSTDTLVPNSRKLFLYSAHDINVINILATLNAFKPNFPHYNAATIVELHKNSTKYYVKVFYISHVDEPITELSISDCGDPCWLNKLEELMLPYFPANLTQECESNVLLESNEYKILV